MIQYSTQFMISNLDGDLNSTFSPQNTSLNEGSLHCLHGIHGFCDASEQAYAAVIYPHVTELDGRTQVSLVTSGTKVALIKQLTIPHLELCGAYLLAQLLHHVRQVFNLSLTQIYAWTDSNIVLSWLIGNPRWFNTYVANRVSYIVELIALDRWN